MSELDALRKISAVITGDVGVSLRLGEVGETSFDKEEIVVSDSLIPVNLRCIPSIVARLREGQVIHESGHFFITRPVEAHLRSWIRRKGNKKLAKALVEIVEDVRVNHYLSNRYRFDFAKRLREFLEVTGEALACSLNRLEEASSEPSFRSAMMLNLLALKVVYKTDSPRSSRSLKQDETMMLDKSIALAHQMRYVYSHQLIVEGLNDLYDMLKSHCSTIDEVYLTILLGGKLGLIAPETFIEMSVNSEGEVEGIEEEAGQSITSVGSGSGILIPPPQPNPKRYMSLVQENMSHIQRLLSMLKASVKPRISYIKWSKRGRLMNSIVSKAVVASFCRDVDNIYKRREIRVEQESVAILLLVDLSGSMDIWEAEDFLTTVSEVMGRWLRDEDLAIFVYGSEYQKIKAFIEQYHITRYRIGGVSSMGGTVLLAPLREAHKMLNAVPSNRRKLCVIVSDFHVSQPEECIREIDNMERDEIDVIAIGICTAVEEQVKEYTKNVVMCENISELADRFVDIYRRIALRNPYSPSRLEPGSGIGRMNTSTPTGAPSSSRRIWANI